MALWLRLALATVIALVSAWICLAIARRAGDRRIGWALLGLTGVIGIVMTAVLVRLPGARARAEKEGKLDR